MDESLADQLRKATDRAMADHITANANYYSPTYPRSDHSLTWNPASFGSSTVSHVSLHTANPKKENKMNAEVKVVRIKAGFVGQVVVSNTIAWESSPKKKFDKAHRAATDHVVEAFA